MVLIQEQANFPLAELIYFKSLLFIVIWLFFYGDPAELFVVIKTFQLVFIIVCLKGKSKR